MSTLSKTVIGAIIGMMLGSAACADEPVFSGTAFAVSDDGWLVTNAHVVKKCTRVEVKGLGFSEQPKIDETNDFAALKVLPDRPVTALKFRKNAVRLGEDILAIGFPLSGLLSDSIKVTTGNVNALAGLANDTRYIQISTPIQPGNSGGPIVDKEGFLLGITTATLSKDVADKLGITAQNVNFAVRSSVAELFLQSQGISYQTAESAAKPISGSTADLVERMTPSVFQVVCYGTPVEAVEVSKVEVRTGVAPPQIPAPTLIDANGYDAIGFDYSTLKDVPLYTCKSACENDSQCKAFTYNRHYNFCFLKRDVVALIRNGDATSAYSSTKSSQVLFSNFTVFRDMDFPGGDYLKLSHSDYLTCFLACVKDDICRAFAYVRRKNECWLKSSLGQQKAIAGIELGIK
jgi:serine protease Do